MAAKHLINSVQDCVYESLYGFAKVNSNISVDLNSNVVFDLDSCRGQEVGIISGGGSGHEPFPAGYVGSSLLTASVSGLIFTSPSSLNILQAIRLCTKKFKEVLLIIPNYTGDVLTFGLAIETAKSEGIAVDSLIVDEDIAQEAYGIINKTGKRGTCGIILIAKIAGYMAATGNNLKSIKSFNTEILKSMATIGLCISPCSKPGAGILFKLESDEVELGVGVHGEAGVARLKSLTAEEAVKILLQLLINHLNINAGDQVIAIVNNLGSLTYLEQWLLAGEVEKQIRKKEVVVARLYAGCFFSSLNMAGVQICLLKLNIKESEFILSALDHPTSALTWPKAINANTGNVSKSIKIDNILENPDGSKERFLLPREKSNLLKVCLINACQDLRDKENYLNLLDSSCGDGDCGNTLKLIAETILLKIRDSQLSFADPSLLFSQISQNIQETAGGTTGAIYGLFFRGVSKELKNHNNFENPLTISRSWKSGIETIKSYSVARIGDRTMIDALETACNVFEELLNSKSEKALDAFRKAILASKEACERTKFMKAVVGRASYTHSSQTQEVDAGCYAVTIWLSAILSVLETH